MMRQLSLEVINNIPSQALVLYTDGSKSDSGRTGSGVYARAEDGLVFRCRFRNPDNCSVFQSELLAIRGALDFVFRLETSDTYILTDIKSSIQNWPKIPEKNRPRNYLQNCYTFTEKQSLHSMDLLPCWSLRQ
ncbi:hypothetical protein AVEN_79878-1 [Araneus ventricosus]|uniref:Uncharacterized protein n=1 Tax=Araneus ventricosus TaxID=182803 RepID=A0A4Y2DSP2_ARAVE|nr:hypothetical protein AVEN_79878-1 [Araneus ventricosus]